MSLIVFSGLAITLGAKPKERLKCGRREFGPQRIREMVPACMRRRRSARVLLAREQGAHQAHMGDQSRAQVWCLLAVTRLASRNILESFVIHAFFKPEVMPEIAYFSLGVCLKQLVYPYLECRTPEDLVCS